jgi:hypothetical protein
MATVEELWAWISPPLQDLAAERSGDPDKPWTELRERFVAATGQHPLSDELVRQLDELSDDDRSALLDNKDRLDELAYRITEQNADTAAESGADSGAESGAAPAAGGYDEAAWHQYLLENGAQWDGTEASWPQFAEWFRYYADQKGLSEPATGLMTYLESQSAAERIATLAQYGVTIAAPEHAAQPEAAQAGGSLVMPGAADIHVSLSEEPEFTALPEDKQAEVVAQVQAALAGG